MAKDDQASRTSETEVSVDMNAADPAKAVTRRASTDIARAARGDEGDGDGKPRTKAEKELFKRMGRLERNLTRQFSQREAEREAAHQREIAALKAQIGKVTVDRGGADDAADKAHETAIAALKDKLAAAYEKGDSAESARITAEMSKLDAQFWAKKAAAAGVTTREDAAAETRRTEEAARASSANKATGPTKAGARFIASNDEWWDDPEFSVEQFATNGIYLELVNKEGFDPKSEETYKEVAKRLKAKFPGLPVKYGRDDVDPGDGDDDDEDIADPAKEGDRQTRARAAAANIQDRGAADLDRQNRRDPNRRTLTKQEIETMRACRLDPDNDRDVVQFMREAAALEAAQ